MEKVPFKKIKKGGFFRMKGRTLWQRGKADAGDLAQVVMGPKTGKCKFFDKGYYNPDTLVTPVNARILEEEEE